MVGRNVERETESVARRFARSFGVEARRLAPSERGIRGGILVMCGCCYCYGLSFVMVSRCGCVQYRNVEITILRVRVVPELLILCITRNTLEVVLQSLWVHLVHAGKKAYMGANTCYDKSSK